jgi:hypothetical protein
MCAPRHGGAYLRLQRLREGGRQQVDPLQSLGITEPGSSRASRIAPSRTHRWRQLAARRWARSAGRLQLPHALLHKLKALREARTSARLQGERGTQGRALESSWSGAVCLRVSSSSSVRRFVFIAAPRHMSSANAVGEGPPTRRPLQLGDRD